MLRSTSGTRRVVLILFALLLSVVFLLPMQSRAFLQGFGKALAQIVAFPLAALSALDRGVTDLWEGYVALHRVHDENRQLRREIEFLRGQNGELREAAAAGQRLAALLQFKEQLRPETVAARVIGRDATNWYRGVILNKGERDGIQVEMGVINRAGVVGRVVKTGLSSSVVLLITDPNNAVTGLIQRTRDEGIVEGAADGLARMKYIPLLSTVREGDMVVTSGLTGGFPRGLAIGAIARTDKAEGDLFQSAEIIPDVDFSKLEEVLVITEPRPLADGAADVRPSPAAPSQERTP